MLVGTRDVATRSIKRDSLPHRSMICSARPRRLARRCDTQDVTVRYAGERADDVASSALDRAIGSASQRQQSSNQYHACWARGRGCRRATFVNEFSVSFSDFDNHITRWSPAPS